MTLWIHVGSHKTGTTSIQNTFFGSRDVLEAAGLIYPTNILGTAWSGRGKLSQLFVAEGVVGDHLSAFAARWPGQNLMLSAEGFEHYSLQQRKRLAATALKHYDDVRLIIYFREPLSLVASRVSTRIRRGVMRFEGGWARLPTYDYALELRGWIDAFGKDRVIARAFDRAQMVGGDVVDDILSVMGLDGGQLALDRVSRNERISLRAALVVDALAARVRPLPQQLLNRAVRLPGERLALPGAVLEKVARANANGVRWLAETSGVVLPQSKEIAMEDCQPVDVAPDVEHLLSLHAAEQGSPAG
ncbi:MAG: hypothetical protein AAGF49_11010 [Pseudomonadota bacterium]